MEKYLQGKRPYLKEMIEYYGDSRRTGKDLKLLGENGEMPEIIRYKGTDSTKCVILYCSHNRRYRSLIDKAAQAVIDTGFDGDVVRLIGGIGGCLSYAKVPYGFKYGALAQARKMKYRYVLYIDSACIAKKPIDKLFDIIQSRCIYAVEKGVLGNSFDIVDNEVVPKPGIEVAGSTKAYRSMLIGLQYAKDIPHISGGLFGIDMQSDIGQDFMHIVGNYMYHEDPFHGGCPDETVYSVALHRNGFRSYIPAAHNDLSPFDHTIFYYERDH